ncbi:MAG: IclR family transcriptional regulator C-terminal domain-containing protein [Acinetobacter sp.]
MAHQDDDLIHPHSAEHIQHGDFIAGLAKGLQILEAFGVDRQRLNVTQVAERTGISRTAARRYLKTLKFLGYLDADEQDAISNYRLTHRVLRFSSAYLSSSFLAKIAQPYLNILCKQTGLTFSMVVLDDHEVVPIARSYLGSTNQKQLNPYGMHLGNRLPAHATSTGKTLLSIQTQLQQQKWIAKFGLKKLTPFTIVDETLFLNRLHDIALAGFCVSKEEHELGVIAIAVPVFNAHGEAVAALNCITSTQHYEEHALIHDILPLLQEQSSALREVL